MAFAASLVNAVGLLTQMASKEWEMWRRCRTLNRYFVIGIDAFRASNMWPV